MNKSEFDRLRFRVTRLYESIYTVSSSLGVSLEEAAAALNAGLTANAGALIDVSNSLGVSLETSSAALQGALAANTAAILGNVNELSGNVAGTIEERAGALQEGLTSIIDVLLPDLSSSTAQKAEALSASLDTLIKVTLPEGFEDVETKRQNLSSSLSDLINQNETTFTNRLDSLDGDVDGIIENIEVITGSWDDYTAAVDSINDYTGSVKTNLGELNVFKNTTNTEVADVKRKVRGLAENENDEEETKTSISALASSIFENYKNLTFNLPSKGLTHPTPENYWAYTVAYPTGRNPFKIKSYSYMGTSAGKKYWNLEDVISYTKRLYGINESVLNYDVNNTMQNGGSPTQNSQLYLKADQVIIEKGRTNLTSPTLTIIGETSETDGYGLDQGQLFIRDEDSSTSGLQIGYKYQLDSATGIPGNQTVEYGRIQAVNSVGATDIYINPAGGSVKINRLNNHYIGDGNIELNYYGNGARDTYIDFHSMYAESQADYQSRIIRWSGVDGMMEIINNGNGGIRNKAVNGTGNIFDWYVNDTRLMFLNSNATLTINSTNYTSDERIKKDIYDSDLGLEFINYLKPVSYKMIIADEVLYISKEKILNGKIINDGNKKSGIRSHYGFIAQQVKECLKEHDFAGYVYDEQSDTHKLNYIEFISPMVKSIQELSQKNDYLEKKLEQKDKQLEEILLRLAAIESKLHD